jgi:hypothetical protein
MAEDLTVEILKQIRDGITNLNTKAEATNERLDRMDLRLDRVERGLRDLGEFMKQIALDQAKHEPFHTHHVDILEKDVVDLQERVRRLEERAYPSDPGSHA